MDGREGAARARKARALVAEIDRQLARIGASSEAERVALWLEGLPVDAWAAIAHAARVNPPSATTIALVVAIFRERLETDGQTTSRAYTEHNSHAQATTPFGRA